MQTVRLDCSDQCRTFDGFENQGNQPILPGSTLDLPIKTKQGHLTALNRGTRLAVVWFNGGITGTADTFVK